GDDFGMAGEAGEFVEMRLRHFLGFVRMNADGGVDPIVRFGERHCGVEFLRAGAGADGEKRVDACGASAVEHGFAVVGELGEVDVGVRVDQVHFCSVDTLACAVECLPRLKWHRQEWLCYFRRAPISTSSSGKPARTGRPSGPTAAAMTMPLDSTPRSLRGARLTTTATLRPMSFSGS